MRQRGFSLLEILVAFSILALALGVLMEIFAGAARNGELARNQMRAVALARSLLAGTAQEPLLAPGDHEGTADGLRWRLRIAPYDGSAAEGAAAAAGRSPLLDAWQVSVTVGWGGPAEAAARSVTLDSLRLRAKAPR